MSGRSQFFMNLGMTLAIGVYGVGGALFSEIFKGANAWDGRVLAVDLVVWLTLLAFAIECFHKAYSIIDKDHE